MICRRCNLPGAIDLDTGGQYHAEPSECIERQGERIAELEREYSALMDSFKEAMDRALAAEAERDQWQENSGQNYVRAQDAEAERDRLRNALKEAADDIESWGSYASDYFQEKHDLAGCVAKTRKALENTDGQ